MDPATWASLISSVVSLFGQKGAADREQGGMNDAIGQLNQGYGQAQDYLSGAGDQTQNIYSQFQPLTGDVIGAMRSEVQGGGMAKQLQEYLANQGQNQINRTMSSRGLSRSGALGGASAQFQSDLANKILQQRMSMLQGLYGTGSQMASNQAQSAQQIGQLQANNIADQARRIAALRAGVGQSQALSVAGQGGAAGSMIQQAMNLVGQFGSAGSGGMPANAIPQNAGGQAMYQHSPKGPYKGGF